MLIFEVVKVNIKMHKKLKIKMYLDFNQNDYSNVEEYINTIIYDHNYLRLAMP